MTPGKNAALFGAIGLACLAISSPLYAGVLDWLPFRSPRDRESSRDSASVERPKNAPRAPARALTDWELSHCARVAFREDEELAPLNLQVSVEQGVATVDGPVPSDFLRRKALAILERLRGIRGVRDNVRVHSAPVPGKPPERHFPAVDRVHRERPALTTGPEMPTLVLPQRRSAQPAPARPVSADATEKADAVSAWQPADPKRTWAPAGVRAGLLPPEAARAEQPALPRVGLGRPIVDSASENIILQRRVEAVLQLDERYAGVRVRIDAGVVFLEGTVTSIASRSTLIGIVAGLEGCADVHDELMIVTAGRNSVIQD